MVLLSKHELYTASEALEHAQEIGLRSTFVAIGLLVMQDVWQSPTTSCTNRKECDQGISKSF